MQTNNIIVNSINKSIYKISLTASSVSRSSSIPINSGSTFEFEEPELKKKSNNYNERYKASNLSYNI